MSLAGADQAGIVAVGVGVLIAVGGGIFKAVNLRGDSNRKWSSRIDLAASALDEKSIAELHRLRSEIDNLLPEPGAPFDPAQAIIDPSPLSERVGQTGKYYRARVRMRKDLNHILRLGRAFVFGLAVLGLGVILLTLHFAELVSWSWMRTAGFASGGLGLVILLLTMIGYGICVDRLAGAEILAETASQGEEG